MRDIHNRCITCGRPPSEECCELCHETRADLGSLKALREVEEVNTEAANQ